MCDPVTLLLGALSAGVGLLGSKKAAKAPDPPAAVNPDTAPDAATARKAGATVRLGGDALTEDTNTAPEYTDFVEKRVSGKALGGLGRSGMAII